MGAARADGVDLPLNAALERARSLLERAERIVVLTGAGVSAESGVPTFRGAGGLWKSHRPEDLATPEAFARDPRLVWEWYAWRRGLVARCAPNAAHLALACLALRRPGALLVTQNVDGLHEAAGSRAVELHGSIWRLRCAGCGAVAPDRAVPLKPLPPRCACGGLKRPDVVWFGESLPEAELGRALDAARSCDLMIVAGTSGIVHPAASLAGATPIHDRKRLAARWRTNAATNIVEAATAAAQRVKRPSAMAMPPTNSDSAAAHAKTIGTGKPRFATPSTKRVSPEARPTTLPQPWPIAR